ncbi:hypothetical protein [Methylophaga sp.]|uniref:hypothetical protein n=1 Tax=Methylophaga sp. TaxID=2024840 RepID=UPI003F6F1FAE
MTLVAFVNRDELEGQKLLENFVSHYRSFMLEPLINPYGSNKPSWAWMSNSWNGVGRFVRHEIKEIVKSRSPDEEYLVTPRSREVIQSMLLHFYVTQKCSKSKLKAVLSDMLVLEKILRERSFDDHADFSSLSVVDLNNALQEEISRNFSELHLVAKTLGYIGAIKSQSVLQWVNPRAKSRSKKNHDDYKGKLNNNNSFKLPDYNAVVAAAEYFRNQPWLTLGESPEGLDSDLKNVIVSSALTILMLIPARSQDIFEQLSVDCLTSANVNDVKVYGINWYAKKTDMDYWKLVPSTANGEFENAIKEAIERIKYVTKPARHVFKTWDEQCPEFDPKAYQKAFENDWLPHGFPIYSIENKVRYSDALMVMLKYQSYGQRDTLKDYAITISKDNFRDWLRAKKGKSAWSGKETYTPSFFERIGYENLSLDTDDYNTHAYRHMVNTAARLGGMTEFQVNWWSHRKEMGSVYDHRTHEHKRNMVENGGNFEAAQLTPQQRLNEINHNMPLTRKNLGLKFELAEQGTGGFTFKTPLGTCTHNYSESPCTRTCNCVECPENLHCKGDKRTLKRLREELDEVNEKIALAVSESDSFGLKRLNIRHEIVDGLVKILGDASPLEDGALIVLSYEQAPDSGLIYKAKEVAKQIEKSNNLISIKHAEAIKQLGLSRTLPLLSSLKKQELLDEINFDEFLSEYYEDEE